MRKRRAVEGGATSREEPPLDEALSRSTLRRRVSSGVFFVGSWGIFNLVVGFVGNVALARMLLPRDFGIVAIGATVMMFATAVSDGGLGSGLIRRPHAPTRVELRTTLGLQLAFTGTLAATAAAIAATFGETGLVVALMMAALPLAAFQAPGRVHLSRAVRLQALATVEAVSMLAYYAWAVTGVVLGFGVWALASGIVLKAAFAAVGISWQSGLGFLTPSLRGVAALRPVIAFGVRFQSVSLVGLVREQSLNSGVALVTGVSTLGLWSLTRRLLELPLVMFDPLHRVSLPLMTHVLAAGEEAGRLVNRAVGVSAVVAGLVLCSTAAAAPDVVPLVFGAQWAPVAVILQWCCAAFLVAGPVSAIGVGYLYAAGAPGLVIRAQVLHTVGVLGVALPLLPYVGPAAIGVGALVGAVLDAVTLSRGIGARTSARPLLVLAPQLLVAAVATSAGLTAAAVVTTPAVAAIASFGTAATVYVGLTALLRAALLRETVRLLGGALRSGLSRETPLAAAGGPA